MNIASSLDITQHLKLQSDIKWEDSASLVMHGIH